MRLRLWRRRLTVSAPRMAIRSALPWPLKWLLAGLVLGLSAAVAVTAFEFGRDIAGFDRSSHADLERLRAENQRLSDALAQAQAVANTVESLQAAERAAQKHLADQLKELQTRNQALQRDLGFFEQLMPANGATGPSVRGLQAVRRSDGRVAWQMLVVQPARQIGDFNADLEVTLIGTLNGKNWTLRDSSAPRKVSVKQFLRLVGDVVVPHGAVVKTVSVKLTQGTQVVLTQSAPVGSDSP